ncbi:aspartate kinase [Luminiphilus syltensis NOR5-1B]|uniref:aspartate kinase n=1 Tax=Luminiphilus syltensis NOR5-1B TaxID=565045 RepID=B8KTM3_9GAMM|nr:aspartate kinase [Luminiphilus syltensis]EED34335.1 aspartate kinase [Luminiphilus syltensis NOR5-1B]
MTRKDSVDAVVDRTRFSPEKGWGAHTVEKIGGTSMSEYASVRDNVICAGGGPEQAIGRMFVVSAYGGVTDRLLEHKKTEEPGVFASFREASDGSTWRQSLDAAKVYLDQINRELFQTASGLADANAFIDKRIETLRGCLENVETLCRHGHFSLDNQLDALREMLASLGEAHSAWNTVQLLRRDGIPAELVDLSGWTDEGDCDLDKRIVDALAPLDITQCVPIITGYAQCAEGLMDRFDRGYSEMTFSRVAVLTGAREAIIHKEYHLSSADPKVVGADVVVPIGRTNYDVADQLSSLGMEAIHPQAARGLREQDIPLRIKNTFEPEHTGTLITADYVSATPRVEIVAGRRGVYALEVFDQDMVGAITKYDQAILKVLERYRVRVVSKDINANTITHFVACNLKTLKRVVLELNEVLPGAEIDQQQVAIVSAIGSDMKIKGVLARTTLALAEAGVTVSAVHQSRRQVDMQFVVAEKDYDAAVSALHAKLVEVEDHGRAIALAS